MTTCTTIKEAIGRSISHNEIARVQVSDQADALRQMEDDENITDLDSARENDGSLDVWGSRLGDEFRIRIAAE